jgi:DNA polymerase (family 10)
MVTNKEISHLLRSVAATYLLTGENRFKIIAYERAADTVDHLNRELYDIWENNNLFSLTGIGPSILSHIDEYFKKGKNSHLIKVIKKIPQAVFSLMKIPHIGPKKAYKLVNVFKLKNVNFAIDDLYKACLNNKVANIESFGTKSQEEIKKGIEIYRRAKTKQERMPLPYAYSLAQEMIDYLKKHPLVSQVDALGSLRRMTSTIGDIDVAVQVQGSRFKVQSYKKIIDYFINYPRRISVLNAGENKASILVTGNKQIDLRIQDKQSYGSMLQYFTGSKAHNIKLREYALKLGYSLSEYGIKPLKKVQSSPMFQSESDPRRYWSGRRTKFKVQNYNPKLKIFEFENEKEFYGFVGLQYIPPEIREGTDEIELAQKHQLPKLVEMKDIKGDFHVHSSYDLKPSHDLGENSCQEILNKAKDLNYDYLAFSEHNPSISNHTEGQIVEILKRRKQDIVQKIKSKEFERIKYFISLEVDILPDGKIAIPQKALSYLDMIIIAIHSSFKMDKENMTKRILKALSYPKVKILAHPSGRLLGKREEIEADWPVIFAECLKKNIALEINAWPQRLDLPDNLVRQAVDNNIKLAINTDAHKNLEMDNMFYGVAVARRGWAKKSDIINAWDYKDVRNWILS